MGDVSETTQEPERLFFLSVHDPDLTQFSDDDLSPLILYVRVVVCLHCFSNFI